MRTGIAVVVLMAAATTAEAQVVERPREMLAGAEVVASTKIDTDWGAGLGARVGLGNVAELELETMTGSYTLAAFRIGVAEERVFRGQPALVLGFRKSFVLEEEGRTSRI